MDEPDWWHWELELSPHVLKRMVDRQFSEIDLRTMLQYATDYESNHEDGRFVIHSRLDGRAWSIIVEPVISDEVLIVITAYPTQ
jgi:hypothetical protein